MKNKAMIVSWRK